jgi:hypothetical protein
MYFKENRWKRKKNCLPRNHTVLFESNSSSPFVHIIHDQIGTILILLTDPGTSKQDSGNLYSATWNRAGCPCSYLTPSPISLFHLNVLWPMSFTVSLTHIHNWRYAGSQLFLWSTNVTVWSSLMYRWFIIANFCKINVPSKLNQIIYAFRSYSVEQLLFISYCYLYKEADISTRSSSRTRRSSRQWVYCNTQ